ncbi:hypothetical protein AJ80_03025 [Polytolypa hystricis UAMH7299]|uniref:NADH-ubiquinone oxidoreductase 21.3 kDa subunit n=1 Tax=Polytolypa hystricis (strain UAMH7299) TaxID=1447883 RepID=A0A2B7YL59_POLH7|nr:hypothetical protein AJ80_03025 [Polytolypa hystricis UAMH7299]
MRPSQVLRAAKPVTNGFSISKKHTLQSTGIWEVIRRVLAVEPDRSNGVPLNSQFRNPTPGALPPLSYDDPVTLPAGDIADNPYWKRDARRNYARQSVLNQGDVVGLLTVGSRAAPKEDVLQIGEAGSRQLVEVKQEGDERGLAPFFEKNKSAETILGPDGLPPMPCNLNPNARYEMGTGDQGYPSK